MKRTDIENLLYYIFKFKKMFQTKTDFLPSFLHNRLLCIVYLFYLDFILPHRYQNLVIIYFFLKQKKSETESKTAAKRKR